MVRRPPFGFFVLALELYAFIAAALAYDNHFIAPLALIFFTNAYNVRVGAGVVSGVSGVTAYLAVANNENGGRDPLSTQ